MLFNFALNNEQKVIVRVAIDDTLQIPKFEIELDELPNV